MTNTGKHDLLRYLLDREPDRLVRDQLNRYVPRYVSAAAAATPAGVAGLAALPNAGDQVRSMLARRQGAAAEQLLRDAAGGPLLRDYAALLLARNKLPAEVAKLRGQVKPGDAAGQRKLAWLLRVNGNLPSAIAAAKAGGDNALATSLVIESCDWKELAKTDAQIPVATLAGLPTGVGRLARIIVLRHLAGDKAGCEAAVAAAIEAVKSKKLDTQSLIKPLVLTGRIDACVEMLKPVASRMAFELLVAQDRMNDAFRLARIDLHAAAKTDWSAWLKAGAKAASPQRVTFAESVAKALHAVGEDGRADELLAVVADEVVAAPTTEARMGLIENGRRARPRSASRPLVPSGARPAGRRHSGPTHRQKCRVRRGSASRAVWQAGRSGHDVVGCPPR